MPGKLYDPLLAFAADVVDDLEAQRTANENRLRQLTRDTADSDGNNRGFGLDESHPDVARLASIVDMMGKAETDAITNLEKRMKAHPLGDWIKATKGIGLKQGARLLATIRDPYWNDLHERTRQVSELWAYCGLHVTDAGVAPKRQRGYKSNWNEDARKRCYLVATSVVKAGGPYREVYDDTKSKYAGACHAQPCVRCGPSGSPAPMGSELSPGHIHARALRAISKAVLKDIWIESRRLYTEDS